MLRDSCLGRVFRECLREVRTALTSICGDCWWPVREAERQRAVEKEDAAGPASEDYWASRKGPLSLVADFHAAVT